MQRPDPPSDASTEILGGQKAIPEEWPATFAFASSSGEVCTATAIGPRVLLTAAHCVADGAEGTIGAAQLPIQCWRHERYSGGASGTGGAAYDLAFCLSDGRVELREGEPYETVDLQTAPRRQEWLVLLGFGCIERGGTAGVLYQGSSSVQMPSTPTSPFFVTKGGASVCSGDSGGGAFRPQPRGARRIVGVASQSLSGDMSQFSLLAHSGVRSFLERWRTSRVDRRTGQRLEVKICGIDEAPLTCHG